MKKRLRLNIDVVFTIKEGVSEEEVYEAIISHFSGPDGEGMRSQGDAEGKTYSVADFEIAEIHKEEHVWGAAMFRPSTDLEEDEEGFDDVNCPACGDYGCSDCEPSHERYSEE